MFVRVITMFSKYKQQRIVSLLHNGHKAPTIARILTQENPPASGQGIQKFLIDRQVGSGRKSKITAKVRRLAKCWKMNYE